MRRAPAIAAAIVAVALLSSSAGAGGDTGWVIDHWSGDSFSGTFTNTTASPINGIAIGTADKAANPIVSFEIDGITCQLYAAYGSAYCYTGLIIPPGHTVRFSGTAKGDLTPAGLQMCSSADRGMDNTCVDVGLGKGTTAGRSLEEKAVAAIISDLTVMVEHENKAVAALEQGDVATAKRNASLSLGGAQAAESRGMHLVLLPEAARKEIQDDITSIYRDDESAIESIGKGKAANDEARVKLEDALRTKHAALHVAHLLPH